MQIDKNKVVSINYTLTDDKGKVLDSSEGKAPLTYLHGSGTIIPGLENALQNLAPGQALKISVPPEQGYGVRNEQLVQPIPREKFGTVTDIQPGMQFQAQSQAGTHVVTVVSSDPQTVTIDANHPLAGETLNFDVRVLEVRDATQDEISHGHVHGAGGHQH
jgi:FKBP-type peptidyl-prolyl cis-trans isomerase SlyD